jgi:phage terminase Nu1 subunit (DNA packaging protein)
MLQAPTAPAEVSASELATLLGLTQRAVQDAAARKILVRAGRGKYRLVDSVHGYCEHLRKLAQGMGGEAALEEAAKQRAKLAKAQAELAEAKAAQMRGESLPTSEVEAFWKGRLRAFRRRVLAIPGRVQYLSARQTVALQQELQLALDELADDAA